MRESVDKETTQHPRPEPGDEAREGEELQRRIKPTNSVGENLERDKECDDEMARPPTDRSPLT